MAGSGECSVVTVRLFQQQSGLGMELRTGPQEKGCHAEKKDFRIVDGGRMRPNLI